MDEVSSSSSKELGDKPVANEGSSTSMWRPRLLGFSSYAPGVGEGQNPQSLHVVVRKPVSDSFAFIVVLFSMRGLDVTCELDDMNVTYYMFKNINKMTLKSKRRGVGTGCYIRVLSDLHVL